VIDTARALQKRLKAAGYDPGLIDGFRGPRTFAALCSYVAGHDLGSLGLALGRGMATWCADFSPLNLAHFIGQGAHETGRMKWLTELGGPTYCARYDGRKDLGNCNPGDGYRFRGRGFPMHLTGRANYAWMSKEVGVDLVANPDRAAAPELSIRIGVIYWRSRGLDHLAEDDDVEAVTEGVNGGHNGLEERRQFTDRAKTMLLP
jgi:putative chitinase